MIASKLGVSASAVSKWAHGDAPVSIETVYTVERMLGVYPVTEFMASEMGRVANGVNNKPAHAMKAQA